MASEGTVVSDHSTAPEQVEKVNEEVKRVEPEGLLPPSKGGGDKEKLKAEELQSQPASSPESEEKMEDKSVEPSLAKELEKPEDQASIESVDKRPPEEAPKMGADVPKSSKSQPEEQPAIVSEGGGDEDKLKAEELQSQPAPSPESEEKMEDKSVETSLAKELEKPEDQASIESVEMRPPEEAPKMGDDVPKAAKSQPEEQPAIVSEGGGDEDKLKAEELQSQPAPSPESEEKMEDKSVEPSLAKELEKIVDTQASDVPIEDRPETPRILEPVTDITKSQPEDQASIESVEKRPPEEAPKVEDDVPKSSKSQPEEQPAIVSVEKQPPVEAAEAVEKIEEQVLKVGDTPEPTTEAVEKQLEEAPKVVVPEPSVVADHAKSQLEEQLTTESVEKQPQEQPLVEAAEKQPEEPPKIGDVPQPSVEAVEKIEDKVEVLLVKELEVKPIKEEIPEPVPEVAEKVEKRSAGSEPEEISKADIAKVGEALVDKIKDPKEEPVVIESSDQIASTNVEARVDAEGDGGECPPTVVPENANAAIKELSGTSAVEESGKVEKGVTEESNEPTTHKVQEVSSISPIQVSKKSLEGDITSGRDIELTAENGKESMKDETVTSVETEKNGEVKGKVDEFAATTAKEQVEEPQKLETEVTGEEAVQTYVTNLVKNGEVKGKVDEVAETTTKEQGEKPQKLETEVKGEETVQTDETNLVKEKEAGEINKPDVPTQESAKEGDETKTSEEPPKEEIISSKPRKQSNNIVAKVKQLLVKAKKAIIGKSHKTVSSENKGDLKDK